MHLPADDTAAPGVLLGRRDISAAERFREKSRRSHAEWTEKPDVCRFVKAFAGHPLDKEPEKDAGGVRVAEGRSRGRSQARL